MRIVSMSVVTLASLGIGVVRSVAGAHLPSGRTRLVSFVSVWLTFDNECLFAYR